MGFRMIVAAGLSLAASGAVFGQESSEGEALYQQACRSCHGPEAQGMASFPALAGKEEEYLVMRLEQYRAGEKVGPNSSLMQPNAADLTDGEIASLSAYIATLEE